MRPDRRKRFGSGFTLLETMVALFLLSVISLVVLQAHRAGFGIWESARGSETRDRRARIVVEQLRRHLASAHPARFLAAGTRRLFFKGDARSIEFLSLTGVSSSGMTGIPHAVRFALEEVDGKRGLRVEEHSWPRRDLPSESGSEPLFSEMIEGIDTFELSYLVRRKEGQAIFPGMVQKSAASTAVTVSAWPVESPRGDEYLASIVVSLGFPGSTEAPGEMRLTFEVPLSDAWRREANRR